MALNDDYSKIGSDIIGAAFEVMRTSGKGLREKYYEAALEYEIIQKGHEVKRQVVIPALYKGKEIEDCYQADLIVDDRVIIEVKAITTMREEECRQLITYLKLSGNRLGYLINFGARDFKIGKSNEPLPYRHGIYRFVNNI